MPVKWYKISSHLRFAVFVNLCQIAPTIYRTVKNANYFEFCIISGDFCFINSILLVPGFIPGPFSNKG